MLNPRGSDGFAQAQAVAPRMVQRLMSISNAIGMGVFTLSIAALCATVYAVSIRPEIVAVSPAGNIIPLVELDTDNEKAVRDQLDAGIAQIVPIPALPADEK